jgi:activator of HSP90 ATPase
MTEPIHQDVTLNADPQRIYDILLSSKLFSAVTGGKPADIQAVPGGAFSCFGGMISGRTVELVPGRRIVQAWRAGNWPDGVYSIVSFSLEADGTGTRVTLDHAGFPAASRDHLEQGWVKNYWDPLKAYLA